MENSQLPEDVVFDILVRLPVKSLLRFRSVCKFWCLLIDSSSFINQHVLRPDNYNHHGSLLIKTRLTIPPIWLFTGHNFETCVDIGPSLNSSLNDNKANSWFLGNLVASYNGIVCLSTPFNDNIVLWNPATKNLTRLPESPFSFPEEDLMNDFRNKVYLGFGYDVNTDDYKVVRVSQYVDQDYSVSNYQVEVYSLQADFWTTVEAALLADFNISHSRTVYFNGHLCWLIGNIRVRKRSLLSFKMSDEAFRSISLPDVISYGSYAPDITLLRDSIACFHYHYEDANFFDIWVLHEYGVKESWMKLYTIKLNRPDTKVRGEAFTENGDFLLLNYSSESRKQLALFDVSKQEIIETFDVRFWNTVMYKESLVSTKKIPHLIR